MPAVARIGDACAGKCSAPGHSANRDFIGVIQTGSSILECDGIPVARVGDTGVTDCPVNPPHHFEIAIGSPVYDEGSPVARVGSDVVIVEGPGNGTITSGSPIHDTL